MKNLAIVFSLLAIAVGGLATYSLAFASTQASTCPGKIVCSITGDEVCKEECPLFDAKRVDCTGKVECPLAGGLLCIDKCPIDLEPAVIKPNCCLGSQ